MIKRFCDKCNKEITNGYRADIYEYGYAEYGFKNDLCHDCAIVVQEFINPKRAEKMKEQIEGDEQ